MTAKQKEFLPGDRVMWMHVFYGKCYGTVIESDNDHVLIRTKALGVEATQARLRHALLKKISVDEWNNQQEED